MIHRSFTIISKQKEDKKCSVYVCTWGRKRGSVPYDRIDVVALVLILSLPYTFVTYLPTFHNPPVLSLLPHPHLAFHLFDYRIFRHLDSTQNFSFPLSSCNGIIVLTLMVMIIVIIVIMIILLIISICRSFGKPSKNVRNRIKLLIEFNIFIKLKIKQKKNENNNRYIQQLIPKQK